MAKNTFLEMACIFLLISSKMIAQEQFYVKNGLEIPTGENVFVSGTNVRLREHPSTDAPILSILSMADPIQIIEKMDLMNSYNGFQSCWYKVSSFDKEGYVLGQFIAFEKIDCNDQTYLFSIAQQEGGTVLRTRVISKENQPVIENISDLGYCPLSIRVGGNRGLEDIDGIIHIKCEMDYSEDGFYLFFTGRELIRALEYTIISTTQDLEAEYFVFPEEKGGIKGRIKYIRSAQYVISHDSREWNIDSNIYCDLEWKDNRIFPEDYRYFHPKP